jgi:hypothetical protein
MSQFVVHDFGTSVAVAPREGAGETRQWFTAYRLCDGEIELNDDTWEPLRCHRSREHDPGGVERLNAYADELVEAPPDDLARQLHGLQTRVFALGNDELPGFLQGQMSRLFPLIPGASLWYVATDETLLGRFTMLRSQLALTLTPDIPVDRDEFEGLLALGAHSLTGGVNFAALFAAPTLVFSPAVRALVLPRPPHALVLFFGANVELRRKPEDAFSDIFRPGLLSRAAWTDEVFWDAVPHSDVEALLPWWAGRMDVLFSHAADPTRFHDALGRHLPGAQTAWHLTLERALADVTLLLADPNQAGITRMQIAFDLLDKCESLLGYSKSGPGFKALLRRSKAVPRLNEAWKGLPGGLERRFRRHTRAAFDTFYADIREHALRHRRTKNGMLVATEDPARPRPMSMDDYVARLVREVRNSAHGLSRQMRGPVGLLVGTHDGALPTQLNDIAILVFFALVADAEKLCAGDWWGDRATS